MTKFAIGLTKGDNYTVLELFDDKDTALAAGTEYRKKFTSEQGLIDCVQAEFDENNQIVGGFKLFEVWR